MHDYDVAIVGSGAAGLCAAVEAADAGADVLVIEAESGVGGSSRLSAGIIMGCASRVQQAAGIDDSAEAFYREYVSVQQWGVQPAIVRRLADESGPAVDWLETLGVRYHQVPIMAGEHSVPRGHVPVEGAGQAVIDLLSLQLKQRRNVDFSFGRRIDRLLFDAGAVVGVAVGTDEVRTGAVVLTTGGFGAAPELVERYLPSAGQPHGWGWYTGAPGSRGDALGLAASAGAQLVGFDCGHIDLRPNFNRDTEAHYPGWLVFVDRNGRRICDETMSCGAIEAVVRHADRPIFAIFDDGSVRQADSSNARRAKKNAIEVDQQSFDWVEDTMVDMIAQGRIRSARTLGELASTIGVPAGNLVATIEQYNEHVEAGHDATYLKEASFMRSVETPPFYATELRLAMLAMTAMGPRIDAEARVVSNEGSPIPGLYAAGECAGGVLGPVYFGHGASWMSCVVFGRIAGRRAVAAASLS